MRWLAALLLCLLCLVGGCTLTSSPALVTVGEPHVRDPLPSGTLYVDGRVKNTSSMPYSGFVTVTLFDEQGKIVAVASGAINTVAPGDEVTYTASGTDNRPAAWARIEAKVTLQSPG